MSQAVATDGVSLALDNVAHTYTWNTDGTLATDSVVVGGNTYIQSFTYTNGRLTDVSRWVKQ